MLEMLKVYCENSFQILSRGGRSKKKEGGVRKRGGKAWVERVVVCRRWGWGGEGGGEEEGNLEVGEGEKVCAVHSRDEAGGGGYFFV